MRSVREHMQLVQRRSWGCWVLGGRGVLLNGPQLSWAAGHVTSAAVPSLIGRSIRSTPCLAT
jgi:hypothetical protein